MFARPTLCWRTKDGRERVVGTSENLSGWGNSAWAGAPVKNLETELVGALGLGKWPQAAPPAASLPQEEALWGGVPTGHEELHQGGGPPGAGSGLQNASLSARLLLMSPLSSWRPWAPNRRMADWPPLRCPVPLAPAPWAGGPAENGYAQKAPLVWLGSLVSAGYGAEDLECPVVFCPPKRFGQGGLGKVMSSSAHGETEPRRVGPSLKGQSLRPAARPGVHPGGLPGTGPEASWCGLMFFPLARWGDLFDSEVRCKLFLSDSALLSSVWGSMLGMCANSVVLTSTDLVSDGDLQFQGKVID